ncbi:MAG: helix-turn-helix transcriptional regulator [Erysipelotrichaceae bacterium]
MNQEKTGKFIATCRKEKKLTQIQLAEKLNITDRAISKWETGRSIPDPSIMLEVCEILDITVNELLTGEKLNMENYKENAEINLLEQQRKEAKFKADKRIFNIVIVSITIVAIIAHLIINYFYPDNTSTGMGDVIVIALVISYLWFFTRNYEIKKK